MKLDSIEKPHNRGLCGFFYTTIRKRFEDLGYSLRDKSSVIIMDFDYQWIDHPNGEGRYIYVFRDFKISYGIGAVQEYKLHEMDINENIIDLSK